MKDYSIKVPICGYIEVSVSAKNKNEAGSIGLAKVSQVVEDFTIAKQFINEVNEFHISAYEKIVEGNFFHASLNEMKTQEY